MWEFLSAALEKGGLVGLSLAMTFIAFAAVVKILWNTNQALARQLREDHDGTAKQLHEMQGSYIGQLRELQQEYTAAVEELQEKRIDEAKAVTDRIVEHTKELHRAIDKLSSAMETLIELQRGGGRR